MNAFWVFLISFPHNCAFSLQHPTGNSPTVNSPTVKPVRVKKKKGGHNSAKSLHNRKTSNLDNFTRASQWEKKQKLQTGGVDFSLRSQ